MRNSLIVSDNIVRSKIVRNAESTHIAVLIKFAKMMDFVTAEINFVMALTVA